jgi:DNA-binding transcriptional LysR family regulator
VEQARAFCAVAEAGSYTGAARALDKDRIAVNRLVSRFTAAVGRGVLVRANKAGRATLTTEGLAALGATRRFLAAADALLQHRPAVRFSAYPTIAQKLVREAPDLLDDTLRVEFVTVTDETRRGGGAGLVADVAAGRLDLAVAPGGQSMPGVQERRLYSWHLRVIGPGRAFDPVGPTLRPSALSGFRLAASPPGHRSRELLLGAFQDDGESLHVEVESESQEFLRDLALNSHQHVAVIPDDAFEGVPDPALGPILSSANTHSYGGAYSLYCRTEDATGSDDSAGDSHGQLIRAVAAQVVSVLSVATPSE